MRETSSSTGTRAGAGAYGSPPSSSGSMGTSSSRRRPSPALSRSPARSKSWVSAAIVLQASDRPREASVLELALDHLAGRVAGQLLQEHHLAGHLEAGEVLLDVV